MKQKEKIDKRHWCHDCGKRRKESLMHIRKGSRGRTQHRFWKCNNCMAENRRYGRTASNLANYTDLKEKNSLSICSQFLCPFTIFSLLIFPGKKLCNGTKIVNDLMVSL